MRCFWASIQSCCVGIKHSLEVLGEMAYIRGHKGVTMMIVYLLFAIAFVFAVMAECRKKQKD
jgi:hypothetical protein